MVNGIARSFGLRVERIVEYDEDELDVFEVLIDHIGPEDPDFFFIQVGANDGRRDDPIQHLVRRYHWRGLLLEPVPWVFEKLVANYRDEPQLLLVNAAIFARDGVVDLWTDPDSDGLMSSFDFANPARYLRSSRLQKISVEALSMRTLIRRHAIDRIDLLQIDAEGYDHEIIKMLLEDDLPLPRLIRYEHVMLSASDRVDCSALLASRGYRMLRDRIDTIAYRSQLMPPEP
jgi:FkbM family methyltransferase